MPAEVLLVEDRDSLRTMLTETLAREGYSVEAVATGDEAVRRLTEGRRYSLVLSDLKLPGADGLAVLDAARAADPGLPVVLLTGYGSVETAVAAMKKGASDFLGKPVDLELLLLLVARHVAARRAGIAQALLAEEAGLSGVPRIAGSSVALADALARVRKAAASDVTVLLTGESGTGKELFARALHGLSARRRGPFVAVNVAVLPEGLVENELFGHEKGAYTGASSRQAGRFELADGGTLFLDEIAELPLPLQAKLLRVTEERSFHRVGGTVPVTVDARLVTATNRDLLARVKAGAFREDLYYRLDVFRVHLPPLRSRREDVPELVAAFVKEASRSRDATLPQVTAEAMEKLTAWDWPGNVRELRNVVERAVLLSGDGVIRAGDVVLGAPSDPPAVLPPLDGSLDEVAESWRRAGEVAAIRRALAEAGGERAAAAEALGIPLRKLVQRIKELRI